MAQKARLTTYTQHYFKKTLRKGICPLPGPIYRDPISFPTFLRLDDAVTESSKENIDCYLNRFREGNKKIANIHFSEPLDADKVKKKKVSETYTEYQYNYCDQDKERQLKEEFLRNKVRLPEDTHVPSTSYQNSFRNPKVIYSGDVKSPPARPPGNNIHERLIDFERVSEYTDNIGKYGELIMNKRLIN